MVRRDRRSPCPSIDTTDADSPSQDGQYSQRDVDHLEIFGSSATLNLFWVRAHVVDDLSLKVGHLEVPAFAHDIILHSTELVELESTMTRLNIVNS